MKRTLALLALAGGCVVEDPIDTGGPASAQFAVPRAGALAEGRDFFSMPFPSDFWRIDGGAGGLDLSLYPRPSALVGEYLDAMGPRLEGFGRNAAIFARFSDAIDPTSLPATPTEAQEEGASVYLVDVDPDSPDRGTRWPARFRFEPSSGESIGRNWLSALPYPGFPLAEDRTYALVITSRVRAADGSPVTAEDDWIAVNGLPTDEDLDRAQAAVAPLLDWLDEAGGDERADVVSAAVFTTQRSTAIMPLIRERVRQLDPPVLREEVETSANDDYVAYDAAFDAPNFQSGDPPYQSQGGEIILDDADGLPVVQRMEPLRTSFTIPTGTMPDAGWPVAIYAHGTGGSYHSFQNDGTARRLARQGIAVISIDQVLHGPRTPGSSPEVAFFNFQNPLAARDNTIQGALDDFSVVRVIEDDPRFDDDKIYFFGHSQGGLTGPPFIAFEPLIKGAVLSGAGGLLYLSMLHKTQPVDITQIVAALIRDQPLDEFNPTLALLQTWIERADPVNYGPLLARAPADGFVPRPIFQSEGLIDDYTPPVSIEALATSIGGNLVVPELQAIDGLALRGREVLTAPVTDNLGGVTVVLLQYPEPADSDGHFVVFDVPAAEAQSAAFLGTLAETGTATLIAAP